MAATIAGAMKAHLEAQGLGLAVFRDGKPEGHPASVYVVVQEGIAETTDPHGDYDDPDGHEGVTELVQVDLYQPARGPSTQPGRTVNAEDYTLRDKVRRLLTGTAVNAYAPFRVYGCTVDTGQRFPIVDNEVRVAWTVRVRRDGQRRP